MKFSTFLLTIVFTMMSISPATAGHRHHYDSHDYYNHNHGYHNEYNHGRRRNHNNNAAYAIGGLIVGGIIATVLTNNLNSGNRRSSYNQPAYTNNARPANYSSSKNYMLQPDGSCYIVSHVVNGSLVLNPTAYRNCQ
jgi:hypothetical protein